MKCPRCGWITEEIDTFCTKCGDEMVPTPSCPIVICNGRLKEKSPCNTELSTDKNFCQKCGKKVDQQLFTHHSNTCPSCDIALDPGCIYCPRCELSQECGQNNTQTPTDSTLVPKTETETGDTDHSHEEEITNQQNNMENKAAITVATDVQTCNKNESETEEKDTQKEEKKVSENGTRGKLANMSKQEKKVSQKEREEINHKNSDPMLSDTDKAEVEGIYKSTDAHTATTDGRADVTTGTSSGKPALNKKNDGERALEINRNTDTGNPRTNDRSENDSQNSSNAQTADTLDKNVHVVFHVLVSENFKFDPARHKIILKIGTCFGGWENDDKVLNFKRFVWENIAEMEFELLVPTRLITGESELQYKYCIINMDKYENGETSKENDKHENKKGFSWENYTVNKTTGPGINRILKIPKRLREIEIWNQYDGFVEKRPKGWLDKISDWYNWKTNLIQHAEMSIKAFSPALCEPARMERCLQNPIEKLENMIICIRNVYYAHGKCWDNEKAHFMKQMGNFLVRAIFASLKLNQSRKEEETGMQTEQRIVWTLAVLQVVRQNKIELENTNAQLLCKALLMKPDVEKQTCIELQYADKHYPEQRKELKESFVYLGKAIAKTTKDPSWLFIMPWIHFLSKCCKPFQTVDNNLAHDKQHPVWWGITHIGEDAIKQFKERTASWFIPITDLLEELYPLFELDYLLPRTFMAAVEVGDLNSVVQNGKIPLEVCVAAVIYYLRVKKPGAHYNCDNVKVFNDISQGETKVKECVITLRKQLEARSTSGKDQQTRWQFVYMLASQMLHEAIDVNRCINMVHCAHVLVYTLAIYDCSLGDTGKQPNGEQTTHLSVLRDSLEKIVKWLDLYGYNFQIGKYLEEDLLVWNLLLAPDQLQSEKVRDEWNKSILKSFSDRLQRKSFEPGNDTTNFVTLYCKKVDEYQPCMRNILSKYAFKAITAEYAVDTMHFSDAEKRNYGELLSNMFNSAWQKQGIIEECTQSVLKHVMTWSPFLEFLKIYYKDQYNIQLLSQECTERLVQCVTALEISVQHLLEGSITIGTLKLIGSTGSIFPALAHQLHERFTVAYISKAVDIRMKEFAAFDTQAQQMSNLTTLCQDLPEVNTHSIDEVLKMHNDIDTYKLNEFCHPALVNEIQVVKDSQPLVNAFLVSDSVLQILPSVQKCLCSKIFMKLWRRECLTIRDTCSTFDEMVQHTWLPVLSRWSKVADEIRIGDIQFEEFETLIEQLAKEDYEKIYGELQTLNLDKCVIVERIEQLKKYRHINTCVNGAKLILDFAEQYKLTGDFEQIRIVANHVYTDFEMRSFDNNLMNLCADLQSLTPERAHCLEMLVSCGALVNWLQESMKESGLKELKVFVDLAFMSAGDEPINIQRVQCLHAAVTGYAPLIFDLKQSSDHKDLLSLCQFVWTELGADPKLPKKLKDTNDGLEWLKEIKKAHGSVEVTSLVQTEAINTTGKYTVGTGAIPQNSKFQMLCDTLKLKVRKGCDESAYRSYTFSQLQDLESRLMLVAGKDDKNNEGIERFTMIFDSVTRLSDVYIKLCAAGCVLFKNWTATFLCNPAKSVCAILAFGEGVDAPKLKARRRDDEDTLRETIPQLAKFMETCLEEWIEYIKDMRKKHFHLNYFTVDQLVILQRELVKLGKAEEPSHLVYPLLSAIKHNCTKDDVTSAMSAVKTELEPDDDTDEPDSLHDWNKTSCTGSSSKVQEETRNANILSFIQELVTAGYDRSLAVKAVGQMSKDFSDPECASDGILWCMDHCDDDEEQIFDAATEHSNFGDKDFVEHDADNQEQHFSRRNTSNLSVQAMIDSKISTLVADLKFNFSFENPIYSAIRYSLRNAFCRDREVGAEPLLRNLKQLWEQFIESITSNIPDYLNLEHLGLILKHLFQNGPSLIDRTIPSGYYEAKPNLIVCSPGDVLNTALSLYMLERDQLLPQSDEILMCTEQTTIDEVDIFWRRALFGRERKIHCLLNADLLQFEVSENAEKCLEQYILDANCKDTNYRLFVLCGSDNEYRSRIVSFLDKYRRPPIPVNKIQLREHLALKLRIGKQAYGVKPAATVDTDRSSVRLIKSWRSGVGKTLYKERREAALVRLNDERIQADNVTIPLQEKHIDMHYVIERFLEHTDHPEEDVVPRIFHLDLAYEVHYGVDYLLFNLLVLGCLMDTTGYVWRKSSTDLYLIETMPLVTQTSDQKVGECLYFHQILSILPDMTCRSPLESLDIYRGIRPRDFRECDQLFDRELFESPIYQRPLQYLLRQDRTIYVQNIDPKKVEGTPELCIQTLLRHCGIQDPSWAELHHFVWFLNTQLCDFEENSFVSVAAAEDLPGFSDFVLRSLIQMSRDFSTRSLKMSEESPGIVYNKHADTIEEEINADDADTNVDESEEVLQGYQMRRTWESSPHPYLFFNSDKTFTFLGFNIERTTRNLIDQQTGQVLEKGIMSKPLYQSLIRNKANLQENFDDLNRNEKIEKLCSVMGIDKHHVDPDPDNTYELTTDNVKKILAIYMRFRCDIPVIIMGETGCGKTRLIKFMCALQTRPGIHVQNMILMKVHGGTTDKDIIRTVREAEKIARENVAKHGKHVFTVLFFDEANTTESIGLIKEIMCDKRMEGKRLDLCENLKMVAACNPYKKHSDELIRKLEQAGLGYHVGAAETTDRLGSVPMRRLVYRVQPLPQSVLPLVWDFGQLNTDVEDLYIRQMVRRYIKDERLPSSFGLVKVLSSILTASQNYMRMQRNECSFVSLRDVDRVLNIMSWFYHQSRNRRTLFNSMDDKVRLWTTPDDLEHSDDFSESDDSDGTEPDAVVIERKDNRLDDITRSLVLALGVCYHACLKTRSEYRDHISLFFENPFNLPGGAEQIESEIVCCQDVFLDNVQLDKNIARNMALKENVFMMIVCIELRIPLFLVGKPGSSKSLAKTIVSDAMQGKTARGDLFKELKQVQMVSFQCSPLSTPDGIIGTFRQCVQFQKDKDLDSFVSIVVLDEVGLAEDSPRMPLKTLHPLLEDGCQGDETPEDYKKVAFVGISNWALDPAKMNRGILVQRDVPDTEELQNSARGICSTEEDSLRLLIEPLIEPMAISYLKIFEEASENMREFFGLRDFYSLVKMVYSFVEKSRKYPTWHQMMHAIKRNFGGLDQFDPVESFRQHLPAFVHISDKPSDGDPDCTSAGLINACLFDISNTLSDSRYLLLLIENYGALTILQQQILARQSHTRPITIFGSSFRSDQEYTQVCRNINKIKVCMETGKTVVLLNLENLYESLYDALNQYYVYFGGERYVDLGLGTHRVKCPVHKDFRLIVVAEKQTVYKKFPIPLINRLEKHFLTVNTMLSPAQQNVVAQLVEWAKQCAKLKLHHTQAYRNESMPRDNIGDVFMGYYDDTCSAIVLHVWNICNGDDADPQVVLHEAKVFLLWCATPDAITQLEKNMLHGEERDEIKTIYWKEQTHDNIVQYLRLKIIQEECKPLFAQVTTHSKLLSSYHKKDISKVTGIELTNITLLDTLSSFDTEQQFSNKIRNHLKRTNKDPGLILIQCDSWDINTGLVACARYCVMEEYQNMHDDLEAQVHIVFVIQLQRGGHFTGFQCGVWHSVHIDDICNNDAGLPAIQDMQGKSVGQLMYDAVVTRKVNIKANENLEIQKCDTVSHINPDEPAVEGLINTTNDLVQYQSSDQNMSPSRNRSGVLTSTETVPLQLDSMDAQFKRAQCISGATKTRDTGGTKLNVRSLILACVQSALSMVKDKDEHSTRTTDRVTLVLKLFHKNTDTDDKSFLEGVSVLLACLLNEKEAHTHMFMSTRELVDEAAKFDVIHKAGTFRRSCLKIVELNISPVLAGIIAYLDTNQNLTILHNDRSWKHHLWLSFLNTPEVLGLQYSDLQSPTRQSDLQEAVVMTTGYEGHVFQCHMPFSWLIYGQIIAILKSQDLETEGDESGTEDLYVRVLGDTSLGMLLKLATDYAIVPELVQEYIHDFVHIMYNAQSDNEHTFITECVAYATGQMTADILEDSILHTLIYVHLAYNSLTLHLAYFRTMNQVWPECSSKIMELKQSTQNRFSFDEDELQGGIGHPHWFLVVLCMLIENLTPVGNELNDPAGRSEWLQKVHQYRPVVEKTIDLIHTYNSDNIGTSAQKVRCLWSRVVVMKLFLEHVCTTCDEDKITVKYCMPFWSLLGEKTNLKNVKSLENVEKFLKNCSKAASKIFEGKVHRCCNCEEIQDASLIVLPCTHLVCDLCYHEIQMPDEVSKCPKCNTLINQDWSPVRQREENEAIKNIQDYQKRCNTFFMDVVSQLCFAENSPPSDEVIKKLLEYIIFTTHEGGRHQVTKELTIFESGIDPTPVLRSFLLQLLMRTSEEKMKVNLEQYLSKAKYLLPEGGFKEKHYVELCLLIIQCLEDMFLQETIKVKEDECMYATKYLRHASQVLLFTGVIKEIEVLYGIAEARAGLLLTAKQIHEIVQLQKNIKVVDRSARQLIMAANILCTEGDLKWPRIYLVKYICRRYGINTYQTVCRSGADYLKWIGMPDINKDKVAVDTDRYLVFGGTYTEIREAVAKVVLGEDIEQLTETLQGLYACEDDADVMFQLAIYREITCSYIYPTPHQKISQEVLDTLDNFILENNSVENKDMLRTFLYNHLGDGPCKHLTVMFGSSVLHQGVQSLLVHFLCVMSQFNASNTLMQPLVMLAKYPEECANTLLPTMPQNDIEDARDALLAACKKYEPRLRTQPLYQCPNGHLYMVGDCGNPTAIAKCRDCGADIGGEKEKLLPDNIKDDSGMDKTLTGHILGRVEMRGQIPVSQRELSRPACAYMRLMTHMAMYVGATDNLQGIQMLIKPDLLPEEVPEFLWQHIMFDITDMQEALGRSDDDILLLGHTMINKIITIQEEADNISKNMYQLTTKDSRRMWEEKFSAKYIQPILQEQDNILKTLNSLLVADNRLGKNPLLGLLNEVDEHKDEESVTKIQNIPAVWRYRTLISVDHLRQELDIIATKTENMEQYKVLRLFLQEEHYLRAIRYIPSVLKLHRALFHKYQRKLDKAEAAIITVGDLKGDNIMGTDTLSILQDFADAWHLVRESLKVYVCPTDVGGMVVPREYCNKHIDDNTPICVLLPTTTKGAGLCSFAMLDFLMRKHNHFLDTYKLYSRRPNDSVSNISAMDVTSTHIINFETQHDILSLLLSNCQYSYEVGKGTNIEYDFAGLERQLMDRFLFSMSRIDVGKVLKIEQMIYRAEFTNAVAFRTLDDKITQVVLSSTVKRAICGEIRLLPELCESLNNLDIAINFLKSVGGDPDHNLNAFMEDILKMKNTLLSHTARQMCQFRHAQSLWMILTLQKSKQLTDDRQPMESIFECVLDQYFDDLPDDVEEKFSEYMQNVSTERLSQLVELLHEYILLRVAVRENPDDEDYTEMKEKELCVWLTVYIEGLDENAQELLPVLKDFPAEIQHRHSVCTWATVYRRLRDKQTV